MNDYDAPLEKLPLFVKGGAIIPMYPEMLYDNEVSADTLTLDCYPYNHENRGKAFPLQIPGIGWSASAKNSVYITSSIIQPR